ncbi:GGDEF domain-containing protein [Chengkuizengella axinellae]|uniref:GGDEF domain-containing protein n=1 Tax=Chengkuizengella axinellae TaxID=3064388 RepID=A0ABT9J573_9BACL|nr:GGDEF domain-containing protein [Chengkuizengella sp. 2205SS18-9]MDP5276755.1 GGDEF domain-containing protein [Chengkuizengella sp. 2205SS18-9]
MRLFFKKTIPYLVIFLFSLGIYFLSKGNVLPTEGVYPPPHRGPIPPPPHGDVPTLPDGISLPPLGAPPPPHLENNNSIYGVTFQYITYSFLGILLYLSYRFNKVKTFVISILLLVSFLSMNYMFHSNTIVLGMNIFFLLSGFILILTIYSRTYSIAYIDELTNIPSRRMLNEDLKKLGSKYTVAMIDIDFFKNINDTYGHDVGDEVLKMVSNCLQKVTGGGKTYRYGGEEFIIIFSKKAIKETYSHLEDLRERVAKQEYIYKEPSKDSQSAKHTIKATVSIGIAEKNDQNMLSNDVIKAADTALYRAKEKGRNCISE